MTAALTWLRRRPAAGLSFGFLLLLFLMAAMAPLVAPYSPTAQDANNALMEPSWAHVFGTDDLGRDLFQRLLERLLMHALRLNHWGGHCARPPIGERLFHTPTRR